MKSLIFGYGITGQSFDRYLTKQGINFDIYDKKDINQPNAYSTLPNKKKLKSYQTIYLSPGINLEENYSNSIFEDLNFITDMDIFFQEDQSCKIGITGTNGKSTCCFHLNQILEESQLVGNIGNPVLDQINSGKKYSIIELSSFQLEKVKEINLDFGILINIAPDHLDYHKTFQKYSDAKNRIRSANVASTESDPRSLYRLITGKEFINDHTFENLPHRLEDVTTIGSFMAINDSKATNLSSMKYAIDKMDQPFCLILCGAPSKEQYEAQEIFGPKKIFIFGAHANEINERIFHKNKALLLNQSLKQALISIIKDENFRSWPCILFAPGHPSGKDYKNFEERGDDFKNIIQNLCSN